MGHHHEEHSCDCEHHAHHHEEGGLKERIIKISVATVLLVVAFIVEKTVTLKTWQLLLVYLVPYLVVGFDTIKEAVEGLIEGEPLNENFLMTISTAGALSVGFFPGAETEFPEAVFVMLFFQVGEMFEGIAERRSRKGISHLMDIRPDIALLERDGAIVEVDPAEVRIGEVVIVRPGDKVPMDGIVLEGSSTLNTVALTGESVPRIVNPGGEVLSGCINLSGLLRVRVEKVFEESTASRILRLVTSAQEKKSKSEGFITRFAKIYTPIVVAAAVLVALVPPLFSGGFAEAFPVWFYRALMFLVVSCPCALVISVPLAFFGTIGGASKRGVLIKGSNFVDLLSSVSTVVFDKTGTLTEGVFEVVAVHPEIIGEKELLHLASHVERFSTHPIAAALRKAYSDEHDECLVTGTEEFTGEGICAIVNGKTVSVGNEKLMERVGAAWHPCSHNGTIVHVAIDGLYVGHIVISDRLKPDAAEAVSALKALGVAKTVMLTGDREEVGRAVAAELGLSDYKAELLPEDKVNEVEKLLGHGPLAFAGDGINDAPVLIRADIGIAMGALGSDAAIEAADVVVMDDKPSRIAEAIRLSRRTLRISRENIWFAIGIKLLVLVLAGFGLATMWMAVFADVGVTVLAVLNSMRTLSSISSPRGRAR
ncbi:MAG: cadmium-translocating P-type ATPase [Bacteroidales bacterium]|nr:cadmium-translocating P-type ATPase [Bacteroidales bacterium]